MKKLRKKIMLGGVIASAAGVVLAGAAGIAVHAIVKAKKKKKAPEAAEAEALMTELEEEPVAKEACAAEIDL